jgi:5'-3' exonuclease
MGIPSYFSHIVKSHRNIIKKFNGTNYNIDNLYLDSNSIIYDIIRELDAKKGDDNRVIKEVCIKIKQYIKIISPKQRVIIAFDGVAPVAKLDQQRTRRYKGDFQKAVVDEIEDNHLKNTQSGTVPVPASQPFDTVCITPGTEFMNKLGNALKNEFKHPDKFHTTCIIVSTSDDPGEGEHKIYSYIRDNAEYHNTTSTVIYGLDADLIMLTLNHLHVAKEMFLFRETPHFIKSIDKSLDPNENYVLDIPMLAEALGTQLNNNTKPSEERKMRIIRDYIFICFMLGNDFMPHFPALNIRTTGIDLLLNAYNHVLGTKCKYLTITDSTCVKVVWANLKKLVQHLSENEHDYIKGEYRLRRKRRNPSRNHSYRQQSVEDSVTSLPLKDYYSEEYINPFEFGWQERYYSELFDIDIDIDINDERKKAISINYLEGLEWTLSYYTTGCKDWRWTYKYNYPPLLSDLMRYIPFFDTEFVETTNIATPVKSEVQLAYVLPRQKLNLLPQKIHRALMAEIPECYQTNLPMKYAFCRYLWEAHIDFPEIKIAKLEEIINNI